MAEAKNAALQDELTRKGQDLAALEVEMTALQSEVEQNTQARAELAELRDEVTRQREAREAVAAEAQENDAALRKELGEAWQMARNFEQRSKDLTQKLESEQAARQASEVALAELRVATEADRVRTAELEQQRHVARRDLQRAEGQIELIKDLLLRGDVL